MSCTATSAVEEACKIPEIYWLTVAIGFKQLQTLCDQPELDCAADSNVYSDGELLPPSSAPRHPAEVH